MKHYIYIVYVCLCLSMYIEVTVYFGHDINLIMNSMDIGLILT